MIPMTYPSTPSPAHVEGPGRWTAALLLDDAARAITQAGHLVERYGLATSRLEVLAEALRHEVGRIMDSTTAEVPL